MQKSPAGAYFSYIYKYEELYALHQGSYYSNKDGVTAMMKAFEEFFLRQNRKMSLLIDFCETKLTDKALGEFMDLILHTDNRITKLRIVECSFMDKWKGRRLIKKTDQLSSLPVKYFSDPEDAKTWLVSGLTWLM